MSKSHHFRGIAQYAEQLMDLAEGRPMFTGRGQKPSNKDVLAAIAAIKKCQQGSFFAPSVRKPCSCGWHTKAAARKRARQAQSDAASASPTPTTSITTTTSPTFASSSPSPSVPPATISAASTSTALSASSSLSPSVGPSTSFSTAASAASPSPSVHPSSSRDQAKVGSGPVPPLFDRSDFQSPMISELRAIGIGVRSSPGKLDLMVYCPLKGRCPHCNSALISANSVGKRKLCYAVPWPKTIVGVDMRCGVCKKHFMTHDPSYVDTLPSEEQIKREFVTSKGNGTHISLLRLLRSGLTVAQVEHYMKDEIQQHYLMLKSNYIELWDKVEGMHGVGKVNVAPRDAFPPFPSHYVPCRPHLTAMFVMDYWENKPYMLRELRAVLSHHTLAVDHQRKVVKRTIGGDVVGRGGQTFTICGDFGLVCGVYVVPDTSLSWTKKAMSEVIDRHESVGVEVPRALYMDCGCCSGKAGYTPPQSTSSDASTSVGAMWRSVFTVKLDAMHLMLRIGREMNAEHPRRRKLLIDLSHAIFVQHEGDRQRLMGARAAAGLEGPPTRSERGKFIRRVVGEPASVAERMTLVLQAHREIDAQCRTQAEAAGMKVDNLTVADIAYPLITRRVTAVFQQQLIHVQNGCISDDPEHLPFVKVGTVNFHSTGHHLDHYRSLRGTSKVEAVHSVLDRTFYSQRGIGSEVFDARLGWWLLGYNRRRLRALGKRVPPDSMPPKICEHYIVRGLCNEFPDWSIAAPGSETSLKIGYEYGRSVTREEQQIELNLDEEAFHADGDQVVPNPQEDRSMVATSAEALQELGIDTADLVDEEPSFFHPSSKHTSQEHQSQSVSAATNITVDMVAEEFPSVIPPSNEAEEMDTDDSLVTDWKSVPLPDTTPGRRRNVSRLRAMGGDPTCVPPDFNRRMLAVWEELWHSMPQSSKVSATVNTLLQEYKKHCTVERKRLQESAETPPALLPVAFAQAKDWLLRKQKAQCQALQIGAVNEEAREVVTELHQSLTEQPAATAALLEQPVRRASPVVPQPVMSLGPEPVTAQVRSEEQAEQRARRQAEESAGPSKKKAAPSQRKASPKKKAIPEELRERQERASARMLELGVPPLQDSTDGKRLCVVCKQLRTSTNKTPDGKIHRVLGRSNKIWCPYGDDSSVLDQFEKEQKERTQAAWRRGNEAKRLKKQLLSQHS